MKKNIIVIVLCLLCNISLAQMIKTFDCIITQEDSSSITYSLKVKFYSTGDKEKRLNLVKKELEIKHQIMPEKIIAIEAFPDKKYLTYRYSVKVKKGNMILILQNFKQIEN